MFEREMQGPYIQYLKRIRFHRDYAFYPELSICIFFSYICMLSKIDT
jgi:hypothetical protein